MAGNTGGNTSEVMRLELERSLLGKLEVVQDRLRVRETVEEMDKMVLQIVVEVESL
jgi:hypothetical protein